MNWIDCLTNMMDVAARADTDRASWDETYKADLISVLKDCRPADDIPSRRHPAFPTPMRRMMVHLQLDAARGWRDHEADMRHAARACDLCPVHETCLRASEPLVDQCPNRQRFGVLAARTPMAA